MGVTLTSTPLLPHRRVFCSGPGNDAHVPQRGNHSGEPQRCCKAFDGHDLLSRFLCAGAPRRFTRPLMVHARTWVFCVIFPCLGENESWLTPTPLVVVVCAHACIVCVFLPCSRLNHGPIRIAVSCVFFASGGCCALSVVVFSSPQQPTTPTPCSPRT